MLKTGEIYETTVNLRDDNHLQIVIHLEPLRYGKKAKDSRGKPTFQHVNLFLHKNSKTTSTGPNLIVEGQTQYLKGYSTLF